MTPVARDQAGAELLPPPPPDEQIPEVKATPLEALAGLQAAPPPALIPQPTPTETAPAPPAAEYSADLPIIASAVGSFAVTLTRGFVERPTKTAPDGLVAKEPDEDAIETMNRGIEKGLRKYCPTAELPWYVEASFGLASVYSSMRLGAERKEPASKKSAVHTNGVSDVAPPPKAAVDRFDVLPRIKPHG